MCNILLFVYYVLCLLSGFRLWLVGFFCCKVVCLPLIIFVENMFGVLWGPSIPLCPGLWSLLSWRGYCGWQVTCDMSCFVPFCVGWTLHKWHSTIQHKTATLNYRIHTMCVVLCVQCALQFDIHYSPHSCVQCSLQCSTIYCKCTLQCEVECKEQCAIQCSVECAVECFFIMCSRVCSIQCNV